MKISVEYNRKAFSLIEMIVAAVLLSGAVVVLCAISTRSLNDVRLNREYELAWDLLDKQLAMIDQIGIDEFLSEGEFSGQFGGEDDSGSMHYWIVQAVQGVPDNLYRVDISVYWGPENNSRSISASTMFNGTGTLALSDQTAKR